MAFLQPRQPFAVLDDSRLQTLGSIKNRQNNLLTQCQFKPPNSAPAKRRLPSSLLTDEYDSENIDPSTFLSPSKRSKNMDGTPNKVSKFVLSTPNTAPSSFLNPGTKRKAALSSLPSLSSSVSTSTTTPIAHSRGSPTNKRLHLSSHRTLTPYRRLDPPKASKSVLPFSIDAALSGTISSYTPPVSVKSLIPPTLISRKGKSIPSSWDFVIREDTPEQEATNLMYHHTETLDISSDDDGASTLAKSKSERGKENIPPPEYTGMTRGPRRVAHKGIKCAIKAEAYTQGPDAMVEDRIALREMDAIAFWDGEGEVVVEEDEETEAIAEEKNAVDALPHPKRQDTATKELEPIVIREDTPEKEVEDLASAP